MPLDLVEILAAVLLASVLRELWLLRHRPAIRRLLEPLTPFQRSQVHLALLINSLGPVRVDELEVVTDMLGAWDRDAKKEQT